MRSKVVLVIFALLLSLHAGPLFASSGKQFKIVVKLEDENKLTFKGTKSQLFKVMKSEARKRESAVEQLDSLRSCTTNECLNDNALANSDITEQILKIESTIEDATQIISTLTNSLFGPKASNASSLKPLTKQELRFFVSELDYQISQCEKLLVDLRSQNHPALVLVFSDFENSNFFRANYTKEMVNRMLVQTYENYILSFKKSVLGLENMIKEGNPEKVSEMRSTPIPALEELIKSIDENLGENLALANNSGGANK